VKLLTKIQFSKKTKMKTMNANPVGIVPTRNHEKPVTSKSVKESDVTNNGKSKSTRPRDALTNITNTKKSSDPKEKKGVSKSSKKVKSTKRPSGVLDTETTKSKGKVEQSGMMKKRKSDPMIIDEEQNNTVSASNSSIIQYEDIDQNDFDDPQAVAEYVNDIYEYLMEKEKDSVDPAYINNQVDVNEKMRAILVDW